MPIRVLAVDDHEVVLLGLRELFKETDIQLAATAKSAAEAKKQLDEQKPDVVLVEVRLEIGDGFRVLKRIKSKSPKLPVILFSGHDELICRARALALGAAGYVLKCDRPSRLINSIRQAARGESAWSADELKQLTGGLIGDFGVFYTPREREVLKQLSHGLTNQEIALMLKISYETAREHVKNIPRKAGAKHRTQAAAWAARMQRA